MIKIYEKFNYLINCLITSLFHDIIKFILIIFKFIINYL